MRGATALVHVMPKSNTDWGRGASSGRLAGAAVGTRRRARFCAISRARPLLCAFARQALLLGSGRGPCPRRSSGRFRYSPLRVATALVLRFHAGGHRPMNRAVPPPMVPLSTGPATLPAILPAWLCGASQVVYGLPSSRPGGPATCSARTSGLGRRAVRSGVAPRRMKPGPLASISHLLTWLAGRG
jgi:hypothetical protein